MKDKVTETMLDGLRQASAAPVEHRLYKSGRLAGLFPAKAGVNGEAAVRAVAEGLLELVRTETKGKAVVEWVRLTPAGVRFLHDEESPIKALEELRVTLVAAREGVPGWLADMRERLQTMERQLADDAQRFLNQLDALTLRVNEGLQRLNALAPRVPDGVAEAVPWALAALTYLDARSTNGADSCPLHELFAALVQTHPDLSMNAFHHGLRHLRDWHALRLLPYASDEPLPQPEYALLEGDAVLYYAARSLLALPNSVP
jgi:hypothetical protein